MKWLVIVMRTKTIDLRGTRIPVTYKGEEAGKVIIHGDYMEVILNHRNEDIIRGLLSNHRCISLEVKGKDEKIL